MKKIALDAGHGMSNRTQGVYDPGAVNVALKRQEHTIVTGMAHRVKDHLLANGDEVLLLESGYVGARDNAAAAWGAQRYLALHCDASTDPSATGTSVWVNRGASQARKDEAERLGKSVAAAMGIRWRGVSEKDFAVLSGKQPDMLLEMFFISNKSDVAAFDKNVDDVEAAIVAFLKWWRPVQQAPALRYRWILAHADEDTAYAEVARLKAAGKAADSVLTSKASYSQLKAALAALPK